MEKIFVMQWLTNIINVFFPKLCNGCGTTLTDNEILICTTCRHHLPITNFHFTNDFTIANVLYGRAKIEQGTALFWFEKKGIVQNIIHNLKYKGQEEIGSFLGKWLGSELATIASYRNIEIVIPVPLHKKKLRKRGYNQVRLFAKEIALALQAEYSEKHLVKLLNSKSQVTKKRFARWQKNKKLFGLKNKEHLCNKHILLVDDIITTGATLEACILTLHQAENVKISVATMAIA